MVDYYLKVKVALSEEEKQLQPKKSGRPRKYKTIEIPVQIHVTWETSQARKDWKDRQRAVEKAQASLDEARIENQARYDG